MPLPVVKAAEARRNARKRAKKQGRRASEKVLSLSEWVRVLTSLPPTLLNTEAVTELYRVRWPQATRTMDASRQVTDWR